MNQTITETLFNQGCTFFENSAISRNATSCVVSSANPLRMRIRPVRARARLKLNEEPECTLRLEWTDEDFYYQKLQLEIFDMRVENIIGNLYHEGHRLITPQSVWRRMNNLSYKTDISGSITHRITQSITKLAFCSVSIRVNVPFREFTDGLAIDSNAILPGRWHLPCAQNGSKPKGNPVYELTGEPVFFRFSRQICQMVRIPTALLNLRECGACDRISRKHAITRDSLLLEIARIRNACRNLPDAGANIRLDSVYDLTHEGKKWHEVNYTTRLRFRACVLKTLDCFEHSGFIASYSETCNGFHIVPGQISETDSEPGVIAEPYIKITRPASKTAGETAVKTNPETSPETTSQTSASAKKSDVRDRRMSSGNSVSAEAAGAVPHNERAGHPGVRAKNSGISIYRDRFRRTGRYREKTHAVQQRKVAAGSLSTDTRSA